MTLYHKAHYINKEFFRKFLQIYTLYTSVCLVVFFLQHCMWVI